MLFVIVAYGLVFGSFLALCGTRVPAGESVVLPPSHCDRCGRRLAWYELIPVFSWLVLRGRCRTCRAPIPVADPLAEAGTAVAWGALWLRWGIGPAFWVGLAASATLVAVTVADLTSRRIPDRLLGPGILVVAALRVWYHPLGWTNYALAGLGALIVLSALHVLSPKAMGLGDAKLLGFAGLWLGWQGTVEAFVLGAALGLAGGLVAIALRRLAPPYRVPFAPALSVGMLVAYLYGGLLWPLAVGRSG